MTMSDQQKPGFMDGLRAGMDKGKPEDSASVKDIKLYVEKHHPDLSPKDRGYLGAWFLGNALEDILSSGFEDV